MRPEAKGLKQEYWNRLEKVRMSALKGNKENGISGKQKNQCTEETLAVSVTMRTAWTPPEFRGVKGDEDALDGRVTTACAPTQPTVLKDGYSLWRC